MEDNAAQEKPNDELSAEELDTLYFRATVALALARQYDVLVTLVANLAGDDIAKDLLELHSRGKLMYPPAIPRIERVDDGR